MQIQPADIAERRRVTRILICVAVLLVAVSVAFQFWLRHLSRGLDGAALLAALKPVLRIFLLLIAACIVGLGVYTVARGSTMQASDAFPQRHPRDPRDTRARGCPGTTARPSLSDRRRNPQRRWLFRSGFLDPVGEQSRLERVKHQ